MRIRNIAIIGIALALLFALAANRQKISEYLVHHTGGPGEPCIVGIKPETEEN